MRLIFYRKCYFYFFRDRSGGVHEYGIYRTLKNRIHTLDGHDHDDDDDRKSVPAREEEEEEHTRAASKRSRFKDRHDFVPIPREKRLCVYTARPYATVRKHAAQ